MRNVCITREPVELYKILKFEGLVASGGEAKLVIADGQVTVNGAVETRKRKKNSGSMSVGKLITLKKLNLKLKMLKI